MKANWNTELRKVTSFNLDAIEDPAPDPSVSHTGFIRPVHVAPGAGFKNTQERAYGHLEIKFSNHPKIILKFGEQWVNTSGAEMVM
jgi:hypothetical protein